LNQGFVYYTIYKSLIEHKFFLVAGCYNTCKKPSSSLFTENLQHNDDYFPVHAWYDIKKKSIYTFVYIFIYLFIILQFSIIFFIYYKIKTSIFLLEVWEGFEEHLMWKALFRYRDMTSKCNSWCTNSSNYRFPRY
jgi:hypothetical protein